MGNNYRDVSELGVKEAEGNERSDNGILRRGKEKRANLLLRRRSKKGKEIKEKE